MMVMTGKDQGAPTEEVFSRLRTDVIDRMTNAKSARCRRSWRSSPPFACDRPRSEDDARRVVASHRFSPVPARCVPRARQELILLSDILGV